MKRPFRRDGEQPSGRRNRYHQPGGGSDLETRPYGIDKALVASARGGLADLPQLAIERRARDPELAGRAPLVASDVVEDLHNVTRDRVAKRAALRGRLYRCRRAPG